MLEDIPEFVPLQPFTSLAEPAKADASKTAAKTDAKADTSKTAAKTDAAKTDASKAKKAPAKDAAAKADAAKKADDSKKADDAKKAEDAKKADASKKADGAKTAAKKDDKKEEKLDGHAWNTKDYFHYNEKEYREATPKPYDTNAEYAGKAKTPEEVKKMAEADLETNYQKGIKDAKESEHTHEEGNLVESN